MDWSQKLISLGLTPQGGNEFAPLTEMEILGIERSVGSRLPDAYRSFLSRFGASDFEQYAVFPTQGGGVAPGYFFGRDLEQTINEYKERLPGLVIPINQDPSGNLICMSLRPNSFGAIYYQSHSAGLGDLGNSRDELDIAKFATLVLLAPDFPSFVSGLESD